MKFTNGYWLLREGVTAYYPAEAYDVEEFCGGLRIYAPVKPIQRRGDTLNCPMLTIEFTSPMEGVVGVRCVHHDGRFKRPPAFQKNSAPIVCRTQITDDIAVLQTGELRVEVQRHPFCIRYFEQGRLLTSSDERNLAYLVDHGKAYTIEQLLLSVGEYIYGLGERFTPYVKNGQTIETWNEDGGTASQIAYKSIPFYTSSRGYGVFADHPENVFYEIGSEKVSRVSFGVEGEELRYYLISGGQKKVLERYTALTGKPALPPAWSFGLWLTSSFTTSYDEKTVSSFIDGMRQRDIPLEVFHFDCFWMREFNWCDFEWDARQFPEPVAMLKRYKETGLKICVWINPYIGQRSPLFDEGCKNGYLLRRPNGDVWQWDMWQAGMALVDFTNPDACRWYRSKLQKLLDAGVDCFKTDFGERIPTDVVYYDGSDPVAMHNYYTYLYNETVFRLLEEERGAGEACLFARSATAGGQQFPVHWGGDCSAQYVSMAETLRGGLSLAHSGFAFWSHDISGFEATATPDLYKRWCAFGLLSTHSRLHGSSSYRVPWNFDEESVDVLRYFTKLKMHLMPYLFAQAVTAHNPGVPVMRPMVLEFENDPACRTLDRQYMLGESILVAPIMNEEGIGEYYLPKGTWTHLLSGEAVQGGCWMENKYDYFSLPLFVRENTLLPFGSTSDCPSYDYAQNVELRLYQLQDGQDTACTISSVDGTPNLHASAVRQGNRITLTLERTDTGASFVLVGVHKVSYTENCVCQDNPTGLRIIPQSSSIRVFL